MTPAARFAALIEIIDLLHQEWQQQPQPRPAEQLLRAYTQKRRYIGGGDRRALQEGLFALLRDYGVLRQHCLAQGLPISGRSLVLLHLAKRKESAAVVFTGTAYSPAKLTELEHRAFEAVAQCTDAEKPIFPAWLEDLLHTQYQAETDALCAALQQPAPLDLRVNLSKVTLQRAQDSLQKEGIATEIITGLNGGLTVEGRSVAVTQTQAYQQGWVEVQDRGSQAVAEMIADTVAVQQSPFTVIDYCAGAGGKSLALAALLGDSCWILAYDINPERLGALPERADRAGATTIRLWQQTPETLPLAEVVVVDVPCSGTGTLRRHPDLAWRLTPQQIEKYQQMQQEILQKAAKLVKPGGWLFFITCSLLECENNQQLSAFLVHKSDFRVVNLGRLWNKADATSLQPFQILPHRHHSDGFFLAGLKREG
jgi:16S rRNA (cytosine967-C5)-methyltransferase